LQKFTFQSPDDSWESLYELASDYDIGLFIGAGVSKNNKIPDWKSLIAQIGNWNNAEVDKFQKRGVSLTTLADIARGSYADAEWAALLRRHLYAGFFEAVRPRLGEVSGLSLEQFINNKDIRHLDKCRRFMKGENSVLKAIVSLCGSGKKKVPNVRIGPILTTNIDCLLQIYDAVIHGKDRVFETVEAASSETDAEKLSLYYLHGYLSTDQNEDKQIPFVFTEAEYLNRNDDPYGWANVTLHWALREFSIVFIGCSMTDELIRRALYRNRQQRMRSNIASRGEAEKLQRRHFAVLGRKNDVTYEQLLNETLARLGVWPLWIDDYDNDLPPRLNRLRKILKKNS
jgi:hypothetical protein